MTPRAWQLTLRSIRTGTRERSVYLLRGVVLLFLSTWVYFQYRTSLFSPQTGLELIVTVAWANWVLLTLVGSGTFSALLVEERESRTLGLLRMAGFSSLSILFGKAGGSLVNMFLLLLVQVPVCMLAITLGGVRVEQVGAVFAILAAHALLVFAMGMFASAWSSTGVQASARTFGLLLVYHLVPILSLGALSRFWPASAGGLAALVQFLGGWRDSLAVTALFRVTGLSGLFRIEYRDVLMIQSAVAVVFLAGAARGLGRTDPDGVAAPDRPGLWRRLFPVAKLNGRFGQRPIQEKDVHLLSGGRRGFWTRMVVYLMVVGLVYLLLGTTSLRYRAEAIMGWSIALLVLDLGLWAERVFRSEVREHTWGSLYGLPQGLGRIVGAKLTAGLIRVVPGLVAIAIGGVHHPPTLADAVVDLFTAPGSWVITGNIAFGLALTVWLSLGRGRGALARSVGVVLAIDVVVMFSLRGSFFSYFRWLPTIWTILAAVFWSGGLLMIVPIRRRLEALAAE